MHIHIYTIDFLILKEKLIIIKKAAFMPLFLTYFNEQKVFFNDEIQKNLSIIALIRKDVTQRFLIKL